MIRELDPTSNTSGSFLQGELLQRCRRLWTSLTCNQLLIKPIWSVIYKNLIGTIDSSVDMPSMKRIRSLAPAQDTMMNLNPCLGSFLSENNPVTKEKEKKKLIEKNSIAAQTLFVSPRGKSELHLQARFDLVRHVHKQPVRCFLHTQ